MRTLLMTASIIACLAAVALAGEQQGDVDLSADLAATLEDFRARYGFPGAMAAIKLPDGTVAKAAAGLADVGFGRGMTPKTPMLVASIGKTCVAARVPALESEDRRILAARTSVTRGLRGQRIAPHVYPGRASSGLLANIADFTDYVRAGMAADHGAVRTHQRCLRGRKTSTPIGRKPIHCGPSSPTAGRLFLADCGQPNWLCRTPALDPTADNGFANNEGGNAPKSGHCESRLSHG